MAAQETLNLLVEVRTFPLQLKKGGSMGKLIKKIDTVGRKEGLEIGIMNNGNLRIGMTKYNSGVPYISDTFLEKETFYSLIEALKEYYKEAYNNQLPLWW